MVLDCHIHIRKDAEPRDVFRAHLAEAGVDGGIIFSESPPRLSGGRSEPAADARKRLEGVLDFTRDAPLLYPFFWVDPIDPSAVEQVDEAVGAGIRGFKVICGNHYPQDDRAMPVYAHIAKKGKPMLFHSGILYNNGPSADFNRPGNFEHLFYVEGLRFAMAHISWPWCDELIAVFGKWNSLRGSHAPGMTAEMYVDLTPGTPVIYRREALTKLLTVGYKLLEDRMIFGTDGNSTYRSAHIARMIARDNMIYDELRVAPDVREKFFSGNLTNFLNG